MLLSIAIICRDLLFCFKLEEYNDCPKQGYKLPLLSTPHPPRHHHCHFYMYPALHEKSSSIKST